MMRSNFSKSLSVKDKKMKMRIAPTASIQSAQGDLMEDRMEAKMAVKKKKKKIGSY